MTGVADAATIGRAVAAALLRCDVRPEVLATHLRLTRPALSRRLNGHVDFRATELAAAGALLGVAPGDFFEVPTPAAPATPAARTRPGRTTR